ncbi:MAG: hypothetical protein ACXWKB_10655 [Methyloceanibacter sp.]
MRMRAFLIWGFVAFGGAQGLSSAPALAASCDHGSSEERIACLTLALSALEAKLDSLTQEVGAKANMTDVLKWNDRVALRNEDMRIFPRCLDNPGPNSTNLTDVFANSCAKVPAQTWMLAKPYQ